MSGAVRSGARRGINREMLKASPMDNGPMSIGVNHFNPIVRVNATSSRRGPHFTRLAGKLSVRAVALRRTLSTFGLPHALKSCSNRAMAMKMKHFKPCIHCSGLFISVPGKASPVRVSLSRTMRLVGGGVRTRRGGFVGMFSTSPSVRILGKHCNPCVDCRGGGCGVPRGMRPTSLDLRTYFGIVRLRGDGTRAHGAGTTSEGEKAIGVRRRSRGPRRSTGDGTTSGMGNATGTGG